MELVRQVLATQPHLTSLNLEFSELEEIDSLLPLLAKFPRLRELHLTGNRLSRLPKSLAALKTLEIIDVSNNMFANSISLVPVLQSLPRLVELNISVRDETEELKIAAALPNLRRINDNRLREDSHIADSLDFDSSGARLRQEDLEQVAILYDEIRSAWKKEEPDHDKVLGADFDAHVKEVMGELFEGVKASTNPFLEQALMVQAKFDLFEICFQKTLEYASRRSEDVEALLSKLKQAHAQIVVELVGIVSSCVPKLQSKTSTTQAELDKAMKETAEVLEAAEQLEKENVALKAEMMQMKVGWEKEREEMVGELEGLREENQRCLDALIKHSKDTATSALSRSQEAVEAQSVRSQSNMSSSRVTVANLQGRSLTLKQLRDVIEEIYASKTKFDQRCAENQLPRETMEQHMYTFLNQKYGLKVLSIQNLIIEWAAGIIAGVKKFSAEDNDVLVFGKILKNECDEEFRFVQVQVKDTISELLKMFLRGKFPLKTNSDIESLLQEKLGGMIAEEEWNDIVKYMYNQTDAEILVGLLLEVQERRMQMMDSPSKKRMTREEILARKERDAVMKGRIPYKDFLKVLLDFQLRGHEKFLQAFVRRFKACDPDNNGIVNESEFRQLISSLNLSVPETEVSRLLQVVDPYNHESITFSECVTLFTAIPQPPDSGQPGMSVLQRLSAQEAE